MLVESENFLKFFLRAVLLRWFARFFLRVALHRRFAPSFARRGLKQKRAGENAGGIDSAARVCYNRMRKTITKSGRRRSLPKI